MAVKSPIVELRARA
uniref:Uncharacterized protein n=1 Tax=Arundo donax TaxID=35708 RepID=A0A0A8YMI8_ARUDO